MFQCLSYEEKCQFTRRGMKWKSLTNLPFLLLNITRQCNCNLAPMPSHLQKSGGEILSWSWTVSGLFPSSAAGSGKIPSHLLCQSRKYSGELPVDDIFIVWSNIAIEIMQKIYYGINVFVYIAIYFLNQRKLGNCLRSRKVNLPKTLFKQ